MGDHQQPNTINVEQTQRVPISKDAYKAVVYIDTRDGKTKHYDPADGCIKIATISTRPSKRFLLWTHIACGALGSLVTFLVLWLVSLYS